MCVWGGEGGRREGEGEWEQASDGRVFGEKEGSVKGDSFMCGVGFSYFVFLLFRKIERRRERAPGGYGEEWCAIGLKTRDWRKITGKDKGESIMRRRGRENEAEVAADRRT